MKEELFEKIDRSYDDMVAIRRYLHMNPELSFQEEKTPAYIADFYKELGMEVQTGVGGSGVVARLRGGRPGKTVALRADFDALPIQDEKEVPYKSTVPGVMHACGHDAHTATLLTLAKSLYEMQEQLAGEYVFIHQHAEEVAPGGAKSMIEAGCLDGVDAIFGTHLWTFNDIGTVAYRTGPIIAASDKFEIIVKGVGGHGAKPHETKDSIVIASHLIVSLQQLVSRRVNPLDSAVLSVGSFSAENAINVIADSAKLGGTVRTFNPKVRDQMEREMRRIIEGAALANDCTIDFTYRRGYPALVNHEQETLLVKTAAETIPGVTEVFETDPEMVGEDFAYYVQQIPGTFFFTGAKPAEAYPHHHPKFDIDEKSMAIAAKVLGAAAMDYQNEQ